ncbi:MAG: hypothetical protein GX675_06430 [Erysipelotrichaceae bacterium]|nr:hypothetical protein [Erysipelotrichaceae bacterium]
MKKYQIIIKTIPYKFRGISGMLNIAITSILFNFMFKLILQFVDPIFEVYFFNIQIVIVLFSYVLVSRYFFYDLSKEQLQSTINITLISNIVLFILVFIFPNIFSIIFYWYGAIGLIIHFLVLLLPKIYILLTLASLICLFTPVYFYIDNKKKMSSTS